MRFCTPMHHWPGASSAVTSPTLAPLIAAAPRATASPILPVRMFAHRRGARRRAARGDATSVRPLAGICDRPRASSPSMLASLPASMLNQN
jgi:hypothetical protein